MTYADTGHAGQGAAALSDQRKKHKKSVYDLAHEAFTAAKGDTEKAAQIMQRRITKDRALLAELSEEFIKMVCQTATGVVLRAERRKVWMPPNYDAGGNGSRVRALSKGNVEILLMNFPLSGGKLLGDAVRSEILDASEMYLKQGGDMIRKGRWLGLIGGRLTDDEIPAKKVLTEKQLQELQVEASRG